MSTSSRARRRTSGAVLAAAAVVLTACSSLTGESGSSSAPAASSGSGAAAGDISIGLLAPLTGGSAADGTLMQQGAQLAVDQLNEDGGVLGRKVSLVTVDVKDQTSAAVSAAVTQLTADPSVVAVITGYASTTNFEIDPLAEAGMPYIIGGNSTQTADIITKDPAKYPGIWSISPTYDGYNTDLPELLETWNSDGTYPLPNRRAYIISSDNPYSNGIAEGLNTNLTAKGWEVTGPDTVPFGAVDDWTTQITKIQQLDPALIVNLDYQTANAAKFLTQFGQNPTDSLVFSQYAPSVPEFVTLAGDAGNGVLYNLPFTPLQTLDRTKEITKAFTEAYSADPGGYGIFLYEEVNLWADAAAKVGDPTRKAEVGAAIGTLDEETAFGQLRFDPATHLSVSGPDAVPFTSYQIQDGQRITITPKDYADGEFQKPSWIK